MSRGIERVLADCLDRIDRGEATIEEVLLAHPESRTELEPLLRLARELRRTPRLRAPESLRTAKRPVFATSESHAPIDLEERRRARAGERSVSRWATPLVRVAAGTAVAILLLGGSVAASAGSLPEEPLFPVKLALENAQLALAASPESRTELQLEFASRRLEEVESAVRLGKTESIERGLELYQERVESVLREQPVEEDVQGLEEQRVQTSLENQQEVLNRVYAQVPEQAQPSILRAIEASSRDRPSSDRRGANSGLRSEARPAITAGPTSAPGLAGASLAAQPAPSGSLRGHDNPTEPGSTVAPTSSVGASSGKERKDDSDKNQDVDRTPAAQGIQELGPSAAGPRGEPDEGSAHMTPASDPGDRRSIGAPASPRATDTAAPQANAPEPRSTAAAERDSGKEEKSDRRAGDPTVFATTQPTQVSDQGGHDRSREGRTGQSSEDTGSPRAEATPTPAQQDRGRREDAAARAEPTVRTEPTAKVEPKSKADPTGGPSSADTGKSDADQEDRGRRSPSQPTDTNRRSSPLDDAIDFLNRIFNRRGR